MASDPTCILHPQTKQSHTIAQLPWVNVNYPKQIMLITSTLLYLLNDLVLTRDVWGKIYWSISGKGLYTCKKENQEEIVSFCIWTLLGFNYCVFLFQYLIFILFLIMCYYCFNIWFLYYSLLCVIIASIPEIALTNLQLWRKSVLC